MHTRADTVTSTAGDTLSTIAWRYYGTSRGQVERILAANLGLSAQPAVPPRSHHHPPARAAGRNAPYTCSLKLEARLKEERAGEEAEGKGKNGQA